MPTRNVVKTYAIESYYHLYTRGVNKQPIFHDAADKEFFLSLFKRYLSVEQSDRKKHTPYKSMADKINLLAYCLMDNHVHILLYQFYDEKAISDLMRRVLTTYSMYFNKKYDRVGPLFQSRYLAKRINSDSYLYHISRYIHRNPKRWRDHEFSSLRYYTGEAQADWVRPALIMGLFDNSPQSYLDFVADMNQSDEQHISEYLAHD